MFLPAGPPVDPVEALVDEAARRGERWVSICRAAFCAAMLARSVGLGVLDHPRLLVGPPAELFAIVFSLWIIRRTTRGPMAAGWFAASVAVDAVVCFAALVTNAIWPHPSYGGVFSQPDSAAILLMIVAAGFRLSTRVALLGAALNAVSAAVLVAIDHAVIGDAVRNGRGVFVLIAIFGVAGAAIAVTLASQTRTLAAAAGRASTRAERARQSLGALLQDHHDVRSLLSSATLNAGLLGRELDAAGDAAPGRTRAAELQRDLRDVASFISTLKERAYRELSAVAGPSVVEVKRALAVVVPAVAQRFPEVRIEDAVPSGVRVHVAGGDVSLERLLLNVIVNACEGDGARGATHVVVRAGPLAPAGDDVRLRVEDDGPGFSDATLKSPLSHAPTTKRDGSGLGLFLVHSIATASDGDVALLRGDAGGAVVEVRLPAAR